MAQGMVDRGADVSCFSQYPFEQEILFAPVRIVYTSRVAASRRVWPRRRRYVQTREPQYPFGHQTRYAPVRRAVALLRRFVAASV